MFHWNKYIFLLLLYTQDALRIPAGAGRQFGGAGRAKSRRKKPRVPTASADIQLPGVAAAAVNQFFLFFNTRYFFFFFSLFSSVLSATLLLQL